MQDIPLRRATRSINPLPQLRIHKGTALLGAMALQSRQRIRTISLCQWVPLR